MAADYLGQMSRNNRRRVNHRIAQALRPLPLPFSNPQGRQMEGRLKGGDAGNLFLHKPRVHGHIMVKENFPFRYLYAFNLDNILVRVQLDIVAQADNRHHCPKLQRNLPADHHHAVQKIPALVHIGQGDNAITELQLNRVNLKQRHHIFGPANFLGLLLCHIHFFLNGLHAEVPLHTPAGH